MIEINKSGGIFIKANKYTKEQIESVDPKELELGIKIEMEHTNDREEAKIFALDHLIKEGFKKYYTNLVDLEKEMKKSKVAVGIGTTHRTPSGKLVKKIGEGKWVEVRDEKGGKTYQSSGRDEGTKGEAKGQTKTADGVDLKEATKHKGKKFRVKGHGKEAVDTRYHGIVGEFTGDFNHDGKPKLKIWDKIKNAFSVIAVPAPVLEMAKSVFLIHRSDTGETVFLKARDDVREIQNFYDLFEKSSDKDKWISEKIKKIMDEGETDNKRAVAIAYSMWEDRNKKKSKKVK